MTHDLQSLLVSLGTTRLTTASLVAPVAVDYDDDEVPPYAAFDERAVARSLPELCGHIRRAARIAPDRPGSVALVDWTMVRRASALLGGQPDFGDPFVALADLAGLIGAVIFNDVVVFLEPSGDTESAAAEVNRLLGVTDVIRGLPVAIAGDAGHTWFGMLNHHSEQAVKELSDPPADEWLTSLGEAWRDVLPGVILPDYREALYTKYEYGTSETIDYVHYGFLFNQGDDSWRLRDDVNTVIAENDYRALFYLNLSSSLEMMLSNGRGGPSVRYTGNCLRSPMMLAWCKRAEAKLDSMTTLPDWLRHEWQALSVERSIPLQMPFWMDALFAECDDREGLPRAVRRMRQRARGLRRTRSRLDRGLRHGNADLIRELTLSLQGDVAALTRRGRAALDTSAHAASVVATTVLPKGPADLVGGAAKAATADDSGWLAKLGLRLFRPHLAIIVGLGAEAKTVPKSLQAAVDLFALPRIDATEPMAFLGRLNSLKWVA